MTSSRVLPTSSHRGRLGIAIGRGLLGLACLCAEATSAGAEPTSAGTEATSAGTTSAGTTSAGAEAETDPRIRARVEVRVGRAESPFAGSDRPGVISEMTNARSTVLSIDWRGNRRRRWGLRVGLAPTLVRQPAGSYVDSKTFGNLELSLRVPLVGDPRAAQLQLQWGLGLPTAGKGPASQDASVRALAATDALHGWMEPELFAAGVVPLRLGLRGRRSRGRAQFEASVDGVVMLPHDQVRAALAGQRALGLVADVGAIARFEVAGGFAIGATAAGVLRLDRTWGPSARSGRANAAAGPIASLSWARKWRIETGATWQFGDALGGTYGFSLAIRRGL